MATKIKAEDIKEFPISIKIGGGVVTLSGRIDARHEVDECIPFAAEGGSDSATFFLTHDSEFEIVDR